MAHVDVICCNSQLLLVIEMDIVKKGVPDFPTLILTLEIEVACYSKMLVYNKNTTQHDDSQDHHFSHYV
jgi:hypothetical protein